MDFGTGTHYYPSRLFLYRLLGQYIPPKNGICARAHIAIRAGLGGISFDIFLYFLTIMYTFVQ